MSPRRCRQVRGNDPSRNRSGVLSLSSSRRARWAAALPLLLAPFTGAAPVDVITPQRDVFVVVVHIDNPVDSISSDELSRIFLKKIRQWESGRTIQVVEQRAAARVRAAFTEEIHRRSVPAVAAYWQQQIFSGRAVPPPERSSDNDILDYVRSSRDAIGYISAGTALGPRVKAIGIRR